MPVHSALWKSESNRSPRPGLAGTDVNCTTVPLDNRLGQEQAQSDALTLGRKEGLEDVACHFRFDAGPRVGEGNHHSAVVQVERDTHGTALGHRLYRVGDDVHEA